MRQDISFLSVGYLGINITNFSTKSIPINLFQSINLAGLTHNTTKEELIKHFEAACKQKVIQMIYIIGLNARH